MEHDEQSSAEKQTISRRSALGLVGGALAESVVTSVVKKAPPEARLAMPQRKRFEGKIVFITGTTSGIGHAAAVTFAAEGKNIFWGRRENLGQQVETGIKAQGGEATYIRADFRDESRVREFVDRAVYQYGRPNVAFNNAGITLEKPALLCQSGCLANKAS